MSKEWARPIYLLQGIKAPFPADRTKELTDTQFPKYLPGIRHRFFHLILATSDSFHSHLRDEDAEALRG